MLLGPTRHSPDVVDLTDDAHFTHLLLDDTLAWRHRLVEYATLGDGDHLTSVSAYQIELPPDLMRPWVGNGHGKRVRALLPITTRPNRPLLQLALEGPSGGPAQLLLRSSIAAIQAGYLEAIVQTSPARDDLQRLLPRELLTAICLTTPGRFREYVALKGPREGYRSYLEDGIGIQVTEEDVRRWRMRQDLAADRLVTVLGEAPDPHSASEQVLLALPHMHRHIHSRADVDVLLGRYVDALEYAVAQGDQEVLTVLAEYGRRWEMIIETEVSLEEPCQVKVREARPIDIHRHGWITEPTPFPLGDARSAHLEMRVDDPHVNVVDKRVTHPPTGGGVGIPIVEAARHTRESFALYSSDMGGPYYVDVALRLQVARGVRASNWVIGLLTAACALLAAWIPDDRELVQTLTLLTVPTTFAVALVLVRETSTLAVRLQAGARVTLAALTVCLWAVTIVRLVQHV